MGGFACVVVTSVNVLCVICKYKCEIEFLYFDPLENYHYVNGYISKQGQKLMETLGKCHHVTSIFYDFIFTTVQKFVVSTFLF